MGGTHRDQGGDSTGAKKILLYFYPMSDIGTHVVKLFRSPNQSYWKKETLENWHSSVDYEDHLKKNRLVLICTAAIEGILTNLLMIVFDLKEVYRQSEDGDLQRNALFKTSASVV